MILHILTGCVAAAAILVIAVIAVFQHRRLRLLHQELAEVQAKANEIGSFLSRLDSFSACFSVSLTTGMGIVVNKTKAESWELMFSFCCGTCFVLAIIMPQCFN